MGLEVLSGEAETESTDATPAEPAAAVAKPQRIRDPQKLEEQARKRLARKLGEKIKKAGKAASESELRALELEVEKLFPGRGPGRPRKDSEALEGEVLEPEAEPELTEAQKRAKLIEDFKPQARELWRGAAGMLQGTPFAIDSAKVDVLVHGTTPYLADNAEAASPKAMFFGTLALVFGPPAVKVAVELGGQLFAKFKAHRAAKANAVHGAPAA